MMNTRLAAPESRDGLPDRDSLIGRATGAVLAQQQESDSAKKCAAM